MSSPVSPDQPGTSVLRHGPWYHPDLRVGDAERTEVADYLAKHYSDGRLDHEEFNDRLDRTMRAKTMAELRLVLADLPHTGPLPLPLPLQAPVPASRRHQRKLARLQLERQRLQLRQERLQQRQALRRVRLHSFRWVPMLVALLIVAIVMVHLLTHSIVAWIVLGLIAVFWILRSTGDHNGSS
jgi:Domain of unknown function (DUF1707)